MPKHILSSCHIWLPDEILATLDEQFVLGTAVEAKQTLWCHMNSVSEPDR